MTTTEAASQPEPADHSSTGDQHRQTTASTRHNDGHCGVAGATIWFTGLPSAGKSTIAQAVAQELRRCSVAVEVLDGDQTRPYLSQDLGFSRADRDLNVTRIGFVARLLSSHGVITLVPVIAPYAEARESVRADHQRHNVAFAEVHIATSLELAEQRDVKGLYAKARRGELSGFTGVDDPYEQPHNAELVLDTAETDLATSVARSKSLISGLIGQDLG